MKLKTFQDIMRRWPTRSEFARDVGVKKGAADQMFRRNRIGVKHWPTLIPAAEKRGMKLDYATLVKLASQSENQSQSGA